MNRDYLTTREAADLLEVSEHAIRDLCRRGLIEGAVQDYKNGPWRIPSTSMKKWRNQDSLTQISKEDGLSPPKRWQRLRNNPWVFYPMLFVSGFSAICILVFAAISAGADFSLASRQLQEQGILRAFQPSNEGETLIIVARFHRPEDIPDTEPHKKIKRAIENRAAELGFSDVRVEIEPRTLTQDDRERAEEIARDYGAKLIIWGEDTGVEFVVKFLNPTEQKTIYREFNL